MSLDDDLEIPKSPRRAGLELAIAVLVIGGLVGAIVIAALGGDNPRRGGPEPFERGMMLGAGLTPAAIAAYLIGSVRQARKLRKRGP